jgi:hypothetical protein
MVPPVRVSVGSLWGGRHGFPNGPFNIITAEPPEKKGKNSRSPSIRGIDIDLKGHQRRSLGTTRILLQEKGIGALYLGNNGL